MGFGESDALGEALRAEDHAESVLEYQRKAEAARQAAVQEGKEIDKAYGAAGERVRDVAYHGRPITSAFEFVLLLLTLLGVAIAALIWQLFFGDDDRHSPSGVHSEEEEHHQFSKVPSFTPGVPHVVVVPAERLHTT